MEIIFDIELEKRITKKKYDNREIILLFQCVDSLEKSISGQVLRIVNIENKVYKIIEKRATRSYRVYFILIIYSNYIIVVDIIAKKFQENYIDYLEKNLENIFKRNFKD